MKVMIMAGGTGGHVYPALAVAEVLRNAGNGVAWMGAANSFESQRVPEAGFALRTIAVSGMRGKGIAKLLTAPLVIGRAVLQAMAILRAERPDVVLGMGGFAAGPGGLAAWLLRIPVVIHEQNAAAGMTNRALARIAHTVLQAFPNTFAGKACTVGNPVRRGFTELPPPAHRAATHGRTKVLVVGGSQGAQALNEWIPKALATMTEAERPDVRHQAGRTLDIARSSYAAAGVEARIEAFIHDMATAIGEADVVVCRSGASTIAELCAAGVASVLVPFPAAVDDHQTANARYLSDVGAAVLLPQKHITAERLAQVLRNLCNDAEERLRMADKARARAWPDATQAIVTALGAAARRQPARSAA